MKESIIESMVEEALSHIEFANQCVLKATGKGRYENLNFGSLGDFKKAISNPNYKWDTYYITGMLREEGLPVFSIYENRKARLRSNFAEFETVLFGAMSRVEFPNKNNEFKFTIRNGFPAIETAWNILIYLPQVENNRRVSLSHGRILSEEERLKFINDLRFN
jgi:hypothetical protein